MESLPGFGESLREGNYHDSPHCRQQGLVWGRGAKNGHSKVGESANLWAEIDPGGGHGGRADSGKKAGGKGFHGFA